MSGDYNFIIKPDLTDRIGRSAGQNEGVIALRDEGMVVIDGVDFTEPGEVAVLDIDAGDVVLAFFFGLGAILFQVVDGRGGNQQAGAFADDDLGIRYVQAEDIAVDDLAGENEPGEAALLVDGDFLHGGFQRRLDLTREFYLYGFLERFAVRAEELCALLGGADTGIIPCKARNNFARTAVQRDERTGLDVGFQLRRAEGKDIIRAGVEPPRTVAPDEVAGLGCGDLGRRAKLGLHIGHLLRQGRYLTGKVGDLAGDDPELILRQQVVFPAGVGVLIVALVDGVQHIIKRGGTLFAEGFQLGRGGVLGTLEQVDLVAELGQLLAESRLRRVAVHLGHGGSGRDALAVLDEVAQRAGAAGDIRLIEEQHTLGVHGIGDGGEDG